MYIYIILYLVYLHYTQGPLSTWRLTRSIKNPYLLVYVSQLGISCFKIWSKIIERCLVKLNCFPICYDFFFWFVFTKNLISRNFLNPLKSKIYLVGNWKDAFTLGDDALAASEFERLEVSEAVGLDALEKSGMI